MKANRQIL